MPDIALTNQAALKTTVSNTYAALVTDLDKRKALWQRVDRPVRESWMANKSDVVMLEAQKLYRYLHTNFFDSTWVDEATWQ